eukprot:CAMPEP_0196253654 /NCGR_PEP_ID=MMETSP0913-20130531/52213_1 /TAXON_ID=49265 /ORGANISM="Thalassiosira rotula, Strain GSO102" /LENGTH=77 /DNA_ID=CAMNT_0041540695 /DNA_START=87 /DNA_END=316 /DNA_ORIENTATION=-
MDDTERYFLCSYFFLTALRCLLEAEIAGSLIFSATMVMHCINVSSSNSVYSIKILGKPGSSRAYACSRLRMSGLLSA